jgi:LCP family protein required for cell wall assembly
LTAGGGASLARVQETLERPPTAAPEEPERVASLAGTLADGRRALRWRFAIGCLLAVAAAATATAVAVFSEVGKVAHALRHNGTIKVSHNVLAPTVAGSPQTLLLVGDDRRPALKTRAHSFVPPHSNEMLLVRLDPNRPTISMLSIPRDLQEPIYKPDGTVAVTRINAAYTYGGVELMVRTIKQVLGVSINHVVVMTFPHFRRAVDEMGCVYSTVDRRYYHVNVPGGEQYFEVNLQPGYQQLCGKSALQFVAYRHGDTALIRDARDQRFLLDAKAQYGPSLLGERDKFEKLFGKAVQTDIHSTGQVLQLLGLLAQMSGRPVRQVQFQANLGKTVTATPAQIQQSVHDWLHGTAKVSKRGVSAAVRSVRHARRHAAQGLALVATPHSDLEQAKAAARHLPFGLEYPRVVNQYAGAGPNSLRVYSLRDLNGHVHHAYDVVVDRGRLGEFYDFQGSSWQNPPLLRDPTQTVKIARRTYDLYYEGDNLRTVAWHEHHAAYWITNTLTDSVPAKEMLAMAQQTTRVGGGVPVARAKTKPHVVRLPKHHRAAVKSTTLDEIGAGLGLASLAVVAALTIMLVRSGRALRELRIACEEIDRAQPSPTGR